MSMTSGDADLTVTRPVPPQLQHRTRHTTPHKAVGRRVNSYGLRHSFATRALAGGESDTIVAALLGHANTTMVHKHYAHVAAMGRQLADAAARIGKAS